MHLKGSGFLGLGFQGMGDGTAGVPNIESAGLSRARTPDTVAP